MSKKRVFQLLVFVVLLLTVGVTVALADPGIDPATVTQLIFPGESADIYKTVTTPEIPPKPDIYFLADTTGSMGPVIAQVQADAANVLTTISGQTTDPYFGAGDYKDFPYDAYAFQNGAALAGDGGAGALAAIGLWSAGGGFDGSEGQFFALNQIADTLNWRADSTRIVVWFGDAPGHDPVCSAISGLGYDITEASLTAKLVAAGIRVVAIGTTTGYAAALDDNPTLSASDYSPPCAISGIALQASRIAAATGGVYLQNVAPADIAAKILEGLGNLPAEVAMASDCANPVSTSFEPGSSDRNQRRRCLLHGDDRRSSRRGRGNL